MLNRSIIFCFVLGLWSFSYSQNINSLFPNFNKAGMESDILYNPSNISNINNYPNQTHNIYSFYQGYKAISFSDFQQRLPDLQNIKNIATSELMSLNIPLALLFTNVINISLFST